MQIIVPSGIGDYSWIHSKLSTLGIPFDVIVTDGGSPRLVPFLEILPCIRTIAPTQMSFPQLRQAAAASKTGKFTRRQLFSHKGPVPLDANWPLETGSRIETWLPEIPADFHYDIPIAAEHEAAAGSLIPKQPYFCIFAANKETSSAWGGWLETQWVTFIQLFRKNVADIPFVIVGAAWDVSFGAEIEQLAFKSGIKIVNLIGKLHIAASLHVIKSSVYFISFPSGLGVLAEVMKQPATMFYAAIPAHKNMIGKWADPKSIDRRRFHECIFPQPKQMVDWLYSSYKLQERI